MEQITSLQNEYIKRLCRLHTAAGRRESGLFLVEGHKLCEEVLSSGWDVDCCLLTERAISSFPVDRYSVKTILISDHIAKKLSTMDTVPGVFAVVHRQEKAIAANPTFILALDHLSDPSNLGAILRSAEAFGTELIFLSEGCVDPLSPKVIRAAMGSLFRAPLQRGSLPDFLAKKKSEGYRIIGAGLDRRYQELQSLSFNEPTVMIIGNESNGITPEIVALCDHGLFIPMLGQNESLNAAVAASIILWEQSKWK